MHTLHVCQSCDAETQTHLECRLLHFSMTDDNKMSVGHTDCRRNAVGCLEHLFVKHSSMGGA